MRKLIVAPMLLAPLAALVLTVFVLASTGSAKVTLPKGGSVQTSAKWTFRTGELVDSSPNIDGSSVYIGSDDDNLYKLNLATGAMQWTFTTGFALRPSNGTIKWSKQTGDGSQVVYASPDAKGEQVLIASEDDKVYSFQMP